MIEKNDKQLYIVTVYDKVANDSSNLMLLKNLDLVPRLLKASRLGTDIDDYEVYVVGLYNPDSRDVIPMNELIDTTVVKESIKKGINNETSR